MAAPGGKVSPIPTSLVARAGPAARWVIQGVAPDSWFGPSQPLQPFAPPEVAGRQWDYPFSVNLNYIPRSTEPIGFGDLRALADNLPLLRAVIETRKDQIASLPWDLRVISDDPAAKKRAKATAAQSAKILDIKSTYLRKPDRQTPFAAWLRMLLEDMLVIDAATIYPRPTLGGGLYSLDAIDGSCYSDDTEVLTRRGWVRFSEIDQAGDWFATRNILTKAFEWQQATYFHEANFSGDMVHFQSRSVDLLVSPNHRMLVSTLPRKLGGSRHRTVGEAVVSAQALLESGHSRLGIPMTSVWRGEPIGEKVFRQPGEGVPLSEGGESICSACGGSYSVQPYRRGETRYCSRKCRGVGQSERKLSGDDYCALMGAYLAEGSTNTNGKDIYLTQAPDGKAFGLYSEMLLRITGRAPLYTGMNFVLCSRPLNHFLRAFGDARDKFIPEDIMNATPRQMKIFWRHYHAGDGSAERDRIFTSSPRMADQLVELAQKLGKSASVRARQPRDTIIKGRLVRAENCVPNYVVSVRDTESMLVSASPVPYSGKIRCVSVPNEFLYVRRNGKPAWCGNTIKPLLALDGRRPEAPSPAYQQILHGVPAADFTVEELLWARD